MAIDATSKANAYEWAGWHGIRFWDVVLDPDGWDRTRLTESLLESITLDEFASRMSQSTVDIAAWLAMAERAGKL
jgi:hypothetical protein